jgi:hypothetical protein
METRITNLLRKTSFCTCSYLKSLRNRRADIVRDAIQSWDKFLELPFAEKIFLDDGSPDINGIKLLKSSNIIHKFNDVKYNTLVHPPHSNFGIVTSMSFCRGEYILHFDDDINVTDSYEHCFDLLERSLDVLDKDENILGINFLTMPSQFEKDWFPDKDYSKNNSFAHPKKYFGTAACLIRKKLLEKVGLIDIVNWGAQQPDMWERLVSDDASSFLVAKAPTPFGLELDSWVYQSTSTVSLRLIKYELQKKFTLLRKHLKSPLKKESE